MTPGQTLSCDALVVGGGIAGLQAALDLADQGFSVVIIERDLSIGGKMIRLSKVFPTLDCSSCITTPKMASAAHHDNITILTWCELQSLESGDDGLTARVTARPRYVDEEKCIGCRKCEYACPVLVPDPEQGGFSGTKAIRIPFSNAIPQVAALDPDHCMLCGRCARACPTGAVDYLQQPREITIAARTAVLATGFEMTSIGERPQYGRGTIPNVITALQMERILAPHGPYNRVLRPMDGMEPDSIAFVQCAGSRDLSMGVPYCSRFCCMYAIKQAMLLSGALPLADIVIYYMDIRAFGKGYEQFYQTAKAMGIQFVKGKVARLEGREGGTVAVHYEAQEGEGVRSDTHDLVVLSMGVVPHWSPSGICRVSTDKDHFIRTVRPSLSPARTDLQGVFVAGAASGPKDIVDTIAEAGAAAMEASNYLAGNPASGVKS
ncbi:MAG TPA: CoB--CoM heterodisulfide reductase iron-sulfur subunit A family protein [Desulfobulbus sp.]|nr:CoB--CoM heterodisulfide reductase iron-sulfur subunit A family protein [Desulfobulbus sp.]